MVKVFCPAKINLSLNILGREDGLHTLDSVMQSVSLGDFVCAKARHDNTINIIFEGAGTEKIDPENNTVQKAVRLLQKKFERFGADITVEKNIPLAGGLGGSSADCAGVLLALDSLFDFSRRGFDIHAAAKSLGSDVCFMLKGGCARVTGTGEIITSVKNALRFDIVVARVAGSGCDSGKAYQEFDRLNPSFSDLPTDTNRLISLLESGDFNAVNLFGNALTQAAQNLCGSIDLVLKAIKLLGAKNAVMTGSGSCCAGYFSNENQAQAAAKKLKEQGFESFYCKTV